MGHPGADLPPEPEDPYPPDPDDDGQDPYHHQEPAGSSGRAQTPADAGAPGLPSSTPRPESAERRADHTAERRDDAPAERRHDAPARRREDHTAGRRQDTPAEHRDDAPAGHRDDAPAGHREDTPPERQEHPPAAAPGASVAPGAPEPGPDADRSPLVIPDDSRDDLPDDVPRTHGRTALLRAIAEGRPVRTAPRARTASAEPRPPAATGEDDGWPPLAADGHGPVPREAPSAPEVAPGAPDDRSASARPRPERDAPSPAGGGRGHEPSARPRGGAALVREAALASRQGAGTRGHGSRGPTPAAAPEEDPTGGASRDDADAAVTSRRPQELITELLGGTVLEVVDESR